ncbi:DNA topoisomerase I-interacting protein [Ceraceosorus bombacis]|uniref:DNA topoisomerase I-interacting protein n=1 Tax=Ceraceosorus bombacis TaxID=401625 RepID=A0A0P1BKW6_9BASI|nr:DNA topoisomerase I-interacting protein [Ceraceosorus bombacis]
MDSESDIELMEEYDLEATSEGTGSSEADSEMERGGRRAFQLNKDAHRSGSEELEGDEDDEREAGDEQYAALRATVVDIVSAIGGLEETDTPDGIRLVYIVGDDVLRCLRDLRQLWRQDEDDPSRLIPRVYAELNVLQGGLLPLLLKAVELGGRGMKIALACVDLITTLTWPVDAMAELRAAKEQDEDDHRIAELSKIIILERALQRYKGDILITRLGESHGSKRDVLSTIMMHVLLPALSKPRPNRTDRDTGTISMCMHLFRNLLAIRDPQATALSSADVIAAARTQSDLIVSMHSAHILDAILTMASGAETRDLEPWSSVAGECIYHIYSGSRPAALVGDLSGIAPESTEAGAAASVLSRRPPLTSLDNKSMRPSALASSLDGEARQKKSQLLATANTRHSRFGTAINFTGSDGQRRVSRQQNAFRKTADELMTETLLKYKRKVRRRKNANEQGAPRHKSEWTKHAKAVLLVWTEKFFRMGFEPLTRAVLKDIRRESAKVGNIEEARVRAMEMSVFFLDYFLMQYSAEALRSRERKDREKGMRAADKGKGRAVDTDEDAQQEEVHNHEAQTDDGKGHAGTWDFGQISFWLEHWSFKMATLRAESSLEKREWLEYVTAVQLWTCLLRTVDAMSRSSSEHQRDLAEGLQTQLYYESSTLALSQTIMRSYKSARSFACLEATVAFAYTMPRMLERYSSDKDNLYVRAKSRVAKAKARAAQGEADDQEVADLEKSAKDHAEVVYKERRFEFDKYQSHMCASEVAAAAVDYLSRWRDFEAPQEQLSAVIGVIHRIAIRAAKVQLFYPFFHRQTLRTLSEGPMLPALEGKAPSAVKDARKMIQYIMHKFDKLSAEEKQHYEMDKTPPKPVKERKMKREIAITPSQGHIEDIRIAVSLLLELNKIRTVNWIREGLEFASSERAQIIRDAEAEDYSTEQPTLETLTKFADFRMQYPNEDVANDATYLPEAKMLCRLVGLSSDDGEIGGWRWWVPASLLPSDLDQDANYIDEGIRFRFDTGGLPLRSFVKLVPKPRAPRQARGNRSGFSDEEGSHDDARRASSVIATSDEEGGDASTSRKHAIQKSREAASARRRTRGGSGQPRKKNRLPAWTRGDFIEDSDEEMEAVARLIAQRDASNAQSGSLGNHASDAEEHGTEQGGTIRRVRSTNSDIDDASDSDEAGSPRRHLHRRDSSNSSGRSKSGSTPATSSPAAEISGLVRKSGSSSQHGDRSSGSNARNGNGLFLGPEESDVEMQGQETDEESVSALQMGSTASRKTASKRGALLDSEDEQADSSLEKATGRLSVSPIKTQAHAKRRRAIIESEDDE